MLYSVERFEKYIKEKSIRGPNNLGVFNVDRKLKRLKVKAPDGLIDLYLN